MTRFLCTHREMERKWWPLPTQSPWSDPQGGARCHVHPDPAAWHPPLRGMFAFRRKFRDLLKVAWCSEARPAGQAPGPSPHTSLPPNPQSTTLTHTQSAFPGLPFLNGHISYCPFVLVIIWNTFFFFRVFIFSRATTEIKLCSNPRDRTPAMRGHVNGKSSGRHLR